MGDEPLLWLVDSNLWFKHYWRLPLPEQLQRRMATEELAFSRVSDLEIATKVRRGHFPGIPPIEQCLSAAVQNAAWNYFFGPSSPFEEYDVTPERVERTAQRDLEQIREDRKAGRLKRWKPGA